LISEKDAAEIRKGPKDPAKPTIAPSKWMYWNVHLDGLERTHDLIVEREGVFKECILAIKMAKVLGYQVATNTTIYKETDMQEIERMFDYLSDLGVDGHTITPGYDYDAAKQRHDQTAEFAAGRFLPHPRYDRSEIPKNRGLDESIHVFRNTGLF
jgi:MoaA/NifB/PqqE/SkfB family radical SAM enzyme